MRRVMALVLSLTLGGCAAHHARVAPEPDAVHEWASVIAIPHGAPVRVTLDYDIDGALDEVTDSTLTLRRPGDMRRVTMNRAMVVRVSVLVPKKMRWRWLGKPLAVGVIGGLVGGLVGAAMRDAKVAVISLGVFTASAIGAVYYVAYQWYDHEWRVVYARR